MPRPPPALPERAASRCACTNRLSLIPPGSKAMLFTMEGNGDSVREVLWIGRGLHVGTVPCVTCTFLSNSL